MIVKGLLFFLITFYAPLVLADADPEKIPTGDLRQCLTDNDSKIRRFEVLPGRGWDNLRNKDSGRIIDFLYSRCKTTDDGRFFIPDEVDTIPLKSSFVETYAELFDHWTNYTSTTSHSINEDAGLKFGHFGLSGKFSSEFESVKQHQVEDNAITTRVQLRYIRYSVKLQSEPNLNKVFRNRLHSIGAHLLLNRTENAYYESQLLVRDYGTHVITSVEAGASLLQEDHIKSTFTKDGSMEKSHIKASASASFMSAVHVGISYDHMTSKEMIDEYIGNRSHSVIKTFGGPLFQISNSTASDWENGIDDDLVALDVSGDPIFYLITPYLFPELPPATVYKVMKVVQSAVEHYYKFNAYRGCTSRDSPNFSYQANIDDGTCQAPVTNFTFAGVYQTCSMADNGAGDLCSGVEQKNPLTGDYSCPSGYTHVLLHEGKLSKTGSIHKCHRCRLISHCCHNEEVRSTATYSTYWCYAQEPPSEKSGFLFGGIYTTAVVNLLTQAHACPKFFYPLHINKDMYVCVSDDYELGFEYSVPFAGFYSCLAGNPLALSNYKESDIAKTGHTLRSYLISGGSEVWPKACPSGYSQHLATVDQSCEINYCVKANAFSDMGLPRIRRPPFMPAPSHGYIDTAPVEVGPRGLEWTYYTDTTQGNSLSGSDQKNNDDDANSLSLGAVAGISVFATLFCIVVASAIVVQIRRHRRKRAFQQRPVSSRIEDDGINQRQSVSYEKDNPTEVILES